MTEKVYTNGFHKNGNANPKKRLFDNSSWTTTTEQSTRKLGEQDATSSNVVGVVVWLLVLTIVIAKFALYIGMENISFKDLGQSLQQSLHHQAANMYEKMSLIRINLTNVIACAFIGFFVTVFSWMIVYLDSDVPGVNPPTPLSPRKNKTGYQLHVKHQYSLGYLMTILNGFAVFMFLLIGS
ncbi:uncharacterized protein LOC134836469 [Culicoides brevitarsis]|uniref:uncharacterized protein LOC134836469 n=1 Tax=Culicoides brevitarsis TaxID=469753 RepID=UPI00307BEB53